MPRIQSVERRRLKKLKKAITSKPTLNRWIKALNTMDHVQVQGLDQEDIKRAQMPGQMIRKPFGHHLPVLGK